MIWVLRVIGVGVLVFIGSVRWQPPPRVYPHITYRTAAQADLAKDVCLLRHEGYPMKDITSALAGAMLTSKAKATVFAATAIGTYCPPR